MNSSKKSFFFSRTLLHKLVPICNNIRSHPLVKLPERNWNALRLFFVSQCPPGVPLSPSGASVPIDQSVRNWLESVRHSWSTSEWVSALGGLSTSWWNSYRVSRLCPPSRLHFVDIQEAPQQSPNIGEHICFSHWPVHRRLECPPVSTGGSPRVSTMGSVTYRCPVGVRCCSPLCRRHLNQAEYSHIWCPSL